MNDQNNFYASRLQLIAQAARKVQGQEDQDLDGFDFEASQNDLSLDLDFE